MCIQYFNALIDGHSRSNCHRKSANIQTLEAYCPTQKYSINLIMSFTLARYRSLYQYLPQSVLVRYFLRRILLSTSQMLALGVGF